eukprot:4869-Heterococcus_DN1.PRE.2
MMLHRHAWRVALIQQDLLIIASTCYCYMYNCTHALTGSDFDETGFECAIEYYYAAKVEGVTKGLLDIDRLQSALQAAQFFSLNKLAAEAKDWAAVCGVTIDTTE